MDQVSGAWTPDVIWSLRDGERCFTELEHDLRGVSAKMLTTRLRMLVRSGAVVRIKRATSPPTVWYKLTPLGQELAQALTVLIEVGCRMKQARENGDSGQGGSTPG